MGTRGEGRTGQAATRRPGTLAENGLEDEGQMEEEEVCLWESGVGFRTEAAPPIAGAPPFGSGTALLAG